MNFRFNISLLSVSPVRGGTGTGLYLEARGGVALRQMCCWKKKNMHEHLLVVPGCYGKDEAKEEDGSCNGPYYDVGSGNT